MSVVGEGDLPVGLDLDGPSAPPRSNGELVFSQPWESRVFGMTIALHQAGLFPWDDFQDQLIAAVGRWEAAHPGGEGYRYYECWFEALQALLDERAVVAPSELDARALTFAGRPAGHDHRHDHDHHDHDHHDDAHR